MYKNKKHDELDLPRRHQRGVGALGTPIIVQANFQDVTTSIRPAALDRLLAAKAKGTFAKVVPTVAARGTNVAAAFLDLLYAVLTREVNEGIGEITSSPFSITFSASN